MQETCFEITAICNSKSTIFSFLIKASDQQHVLRQRSIAPQQMSIYPNRNAEVMIN
jgi:hypothetical protein